MIIFYTTHILDKHAILQDEEAQHCTQVLRKRVGDAVQWVDGKGGWYEGSIADISKKEVRLHVQHARQLPAAPYQIHIAISPTKQMERLEWFLEKVTEIGIQHITPLLCARTERTHLRMDRLEKILLSAMKQTLKAHLPTLHPATTFTDFLKKNANDPAQRMIGYLDEEEKIHLKHYYQKGSNAIFLVGPAGDFTPDEIQLAFQNGYKGVSLGNSRLRTETAGIVACHALNLLNE